jgi:hypothetical protein
MRKLLIVIASIVLVVAAAGAGEPGADRFQKVADRLVAAINAGDGAAIQRDWADVMLKALPREKSDPFFAGVVAQLGKIKGLDAPDLTEPSTAVFVAHFERGTLDLKMVLDAHDKIIGLWLLPHTPPAPVPERNTTPLQLPFNGRWLVVWGGDTKELNQHHDNRGQRFAFDFIGAGPDGKTPKSAGRANEDYYAFGREILAPADGTVTEAIDGVRDNVPGSMNPYAAVGNCVILRHAEHEVSVLAHFKQGSVRVKAGEKVKAGQVLGLCGNSGNSSEPHLHYHLQNTPVFQDGTGIKCFFRKVTLVAKDGKKEVKADYSPVKDDTLEAP